MVFQIYSHTFITIKIFKDDKLTYYYIYKNGISKENYCNTRTVSAYTY